MTGEPHTERLHDRAALVDVLVYHWRTETSGCGCGWAVLGASHAEHVADVYEMELARHVCGPDLTAETEIRQNELYLAMRAVEEMPASEAQTACIVKLGERMRSLVELRGKSEVGRSLDA